MREEIQNMSKRKCPEKIIIGKRLRTAREARGLTVNEVASILEWDRQTIAINPNDPK